MSLEYLEIHDADSMWMIGKENKKLCANDFTTELFTSVLQMIHKIFIYNHGHNILRLFDPLPTLFSPQVKRNVILVTNMVYTSCFTSVRTT